MAVTTEPMRLRPAIVTALGSVTVGLVLTCAFTASTWSGGGVGSLLELLRAGVRTWLVSHGSGLVADGTVVDLVPLGASLVAVALVAWVSRRSLAEPDEDADPSNEAVPYIAVTAAVYGVIAGVLSAGTNTGSHSTHFIRSALGGVVIAALGAAIGFAANSRRPAESAESSGVVPWPRCQGGPWPVLRAACRGAFALLAAALALVILLFVSQLGRASDMWAALDPGPLGSLGLAGVTLAVLPNLVLWTVAALLGPGFALGAGTSLDLSGAHLGAVPGLPILAGLPGPGPFPGWVFLLGLVPLLAGGYAGWRVATAVDADWPRQLSLGALAGALAGLACGVLVALSGGAIGPGRMAIAGPDRLAPILVAVAVLAFGGVLGAALRAARLRVPSRQEPAAP